MNQKLIDQVAEANRLLKANSSVLHSDRFFISAYEESEKAIYLPGFDKNSGLMHENIICVNSEDKLDGILALHKAVYLKNKKCRSILLSQKLYTMCYTQLRECIPPLNTIHASSFYGEIPCAESVYPLEDQENYAVKMMTSVEKAFQKYKCGTMPAVLIPFEGALCFGSSPLETYIIAEKLEYIAQIAFFTRLATSGCYEYMPLELMQQVHQGGAKR